MNIQRLSKDEQEAFKAPFEISEKAYKVRLDSLPPCKWEHSEGSEAFHSCERLVGNIVNWFVCLKDRYFQLATFDSQDKAEIVATVREQFYAEEMLKAYKS